MSRARFQQGTLVRRDDADGFTWILRYNKDGVRKALTIGTNRDLPTETDARIKAANMVSVINASKPVYTFAQLVERYEREALPSRPQTAASYKSMLKHIKAKWGAYELVELLSDLVAIGDWVSGLKTMPTKSGKPARTASKKTKQNVKAMLHRLINCGMRWGYLPVTENPIALVEIKVTGIQPKKRLKKPLTLAQIKAAQTDKEVPEHVRVMVKLSVGLGLRISEVLGLRWEDVDFERNVISIERSSVGKHLGDTKSEESRCELPLHQYLVDVLLAWREAMPVVAGWLFGNETTKRPFHRDSLQADHLIPLGVRCGIPSLGWHTFRHTHSKLHRQVGTPLEVQQMSMRHADIATTNDYGQDDGSMDLKRKANDAVFDLLLREENK